MGKKINFEKERIIKKKTSKLHTFSKLLQHTCKLNNQGAISEFLTTRGSSLSPSAPTHYS